MENQQEYSYVNILTCFVYIRMYIQIEKSNYYLKNITENTVIKIIRKQPYAEESRKQMK
jgi:hypothetical protein